MKFITTAPSLVFSLLAVVSAHSTSPLEPRAGLCPNNVLSCAAHGNVDSCCVPFHGLLVHTQQWHRDLGPNNKFTMHGLWPNNCDGSHDNSNWCERRPGGDRSREYNDVEDILYDYPDKRNGFLDDMYKYWPSFKPTPQNPDFNEFWKREWGKHGTCLSTLDPSCMGKEKAVYSYFNKSLELRKKYDIYAALAAHNIKPGDTYSVDDMINTIEQELGVGAAVSCEHEQNGETNPLEFRLFFRVKNKDQYRPVMRPDNTDKEQWCDNSMVDYQIKLTKSDENWPTH